MNKALTESKKEFLTLLAKSQMEIEYISKGKVIPTAECISVCAGLASYVLAELHIHGLAKSQDVLFKELIDKLKAQKQLHLLAPEVLAKIPDSFFEDVDVGVDTETNNKEKGNNNETNGKN